ncbi:DUF5634 family protein [Bacillus sp. FJAT-45350]|uniref:DUF5634 family protein n=1 Tax=Bacillus sp. FJAT-45350 TaxID=2011014 RepID=UPI0015C90A92|nr:DUF5634 family protein [Bacillus sp. FJAT-45350]
MDFISRETIVAEMNESMQSLLDKYSLDDIGVFEEQGEGDTYYLGYTIRKNGEIYMIHKPFKKNDENQLLIEKQEWIIETDDGDTGGFTNLDEVFATINKGFTH